MKKELVLSELNSVITKLEDAKQQMLDIQNGISFVDGNKEIEKYMSVFDAISDSALFHVLISMSGEIRTDKIALPSVLV